jgi:hypothetical protein
VGLQQFVAGERCYQWLLLLRDSTIADIFSSGHDLLSATSSDGGTKVLR